MSTSKLHRYVSRIGPRGPLRKEVRPVDAWAAAENEGWPSRLLLVGRLVKRDDSKGLSDNDPRGPLAALAGRSRVERLDRSQQILKCVIGEAYRCVTARRKADSN
jgi:hypothetical protein